MNKALGYLVPGATWQLTGLAAVDTPQMKEVGGRTAIVTPRRGDFITSCRDVNPGRQTRSSRRESSQFRDCLLPLSCLRALLG